LKRNEEISVQNPIPELLRWVGLKIEKDLLELLLPFISKCLEEVGRVFDNDFVIN